MRSFRRNSGAGRGLRVAALLLTALFLMGAAGSDDDPGLWQKVKKAFKKKEKPLPPVELVYEEAEAYFHGRETWYGKMVRKTYGEDSWAYDNFWWVKRKDYYEALEAYRKVVDNYPFSKYSPPSYLKMADCHYHLEEYEQAAVLYRQFVRMYPRRDEVPYAIYQEGMCHYDQMLKPPRDQEDTREAVVLFRELLALYPDSDMAPDAKQKLDECRERLVKREFLVADFYYDRKEYWAASARYRGIYENYSDLGHGERAMFMEGSCYDELGKTDRALKMYEMVADDFPEGEFGDRARERISALSETEG